MKSFKSMLPSIVADCVWPLKDSTYGMVGIEFYFHYAIYEHLGLDLLFACLSLPADQNLTTSSLPTFSDLVP